MSLNETMKALADDERREILEHLRERPMSAGEIAANFDLSNATVSYHLKVLKKAGLITENREKNYIIYSLSASVFEDVLAWFYKIGGKKEDDE
ncbi:autorepressor SdpR family transcription factor [Xylocopilactobacillus apicola]|uniref:Transcriptional regulator n=1 Tax=Xylocopilactobacillus apicola TaxID=2932184 RepID=A0AAU9DD46_9LACO|nr:autorepressor SdpR family transcription factor [Xylocopilactobacillus apicola]BDR57720.1 transcriptional regulator [Xylocopilactobacillus apicola]